MLDQALDWEKCVWLCTDRALSMAGCHSRKNTKNCKQKSAVYTLHNPLRTFSSPETVT